ncbi:uncharacterized protein LOC116119273 [Pistacia vera]|uniref:uncharacterized protein LOC116119273 n=1 Tax=Pistacia vera TaxID=55513 RepID=UPI001262BCDA|nr:uncharacterized protein LOC116119273 [Pistacia vera]
MKNPPSVRNNKKYCRYHRDNRHHIDECRVLKQATENLTKQGHFKEYVDGPTPILEKDQEEPGKKCCCHKGLYCIGIIFGGSHLMGNSRGAQERYAQEARHDPVSVISTVWEEEITFSKKDAVQMHHPHHPHEDAFVIAPELDRCEVHRMLLDNGSVVNILFQRAFEKMQLDEANLKPASIPLYGFTRDHLIPRGTILLSVTLGEADEVTKMTEFLVVDCPSTFNSILGRPLLRNFKVVIYLPSNNEVPYPNRDRESKQIST